MTDFFMAEVDAPEQAEFAWTLHDVLAERDRRVEVGPNPLLRMSRSSENGMIVESSYGYPGRLGSALRLKRLFNGSYSLEHIVLTLNSAPDVALSLVFKWDFDGWHWTHRAAMKQGYPTPYGLIKMADAWHILLDHHAMVVLPRSNEDVSTASWLV